MAPKLRTYLKDQLTAGGVALPKELAYLAKAKYYAISQRTIGRKVVWHVEIEGSVFEKLLKGKKSNSNLRARNSALKASSRQIASDNENLLKDNTALEAANKRLMKNIEDDKRPDKFVRSPKSYLNAAEDHAFKPHNDLPLQGGLPGLGKR